MQLIQRLDKKLNRLEAQQVASTSRLDLVQNLVFDKLPEYERRFVKLANELNEFTFKMQQS